MNDPRFESLPSDTSKYIDRLARDLAWGVLNNKWYNEFYLQGIPQWRDLAFSKRNRIEIQQYMADVWQNHSLDLVLLEDLGYIIEVQKEGNDTSLYKLTDKALQLPRIPVPGPIFISYRRFESTPFALLLSCRLKANGITPFLDDQVDKEDQGTSLRIGGNWRPDLKDAIESREWFVILIGPTTLSSVDVKHELEWALAAHKKIIPIWHRGFKGEDLPDDLSTSVREAITETNAIRI